MQHPDSTFVSSGSWLCENSAGSDDSGRLDAGLMQHRFAGRGQQGGLLYLMRRQSSSLPSIHQHAGISRGAFAPIRQSACPLGCSRTPSYLTLPAQSQGARAGRRHAPDLRRMDTADCTSHAGTRSVRRQAIARTTTKDTAHRCNETAANRLPRRFVRICLIAVQRRSAKKRRAGDARPIDCKIKGPALCGPESVGRSRK